MYSANCIAIFYYCVCCLNYQSSVRAKKLIPYHFKVNRSFYLQNIGKYRKFVTIILGRLGEIEELDALHVILTDFHSGKLDKGDLPHAFVTPFSAESRGNSGFEQIWTLRTWLICTLQQCSNSFCGVLFWETLFHGDKQLNIKIVQWSSTCGHNAHHQYLAVALWCIS